MAAEISERNTFPGVGEGNYRVVDWGSVRSPQVISGVLLDAKDRVLAAYYTHEIKDKHTIQWSSDNNTLSGGQSIGIFEKITFNEKKPPTIGNFLENHPSSPGADVRISTDLRAKLMKIDKPTLKSSRDSTRLE